MGNRLPTSHLDDLSLVCQLTPYIPQRHDITQNRVVGVVKSFFLSSTSHMQWRNTEGQAKQSPLDGKKSPLSGAPRSKVY